MADGKASPRIVCCDVIKRNSPEGKKPKRERLRTLIESMVISAPSVAQIISATAYPPTHQLVAAYLGYEHQDPQTGNSFLKAIAAQAKQAKHNKTSS